jgi:hypothetical protein
MSPDAKRVIQRKMGELLLERGFITRAILDEALSFQKLYGGFLGDYLIKRGYVKEEEIIQCLSSQYGFPYIQLSNFKIDKETLNLVPVSVAEKYCLIPIDKISGLVTIAIANPLNQEALDMVRSVTKSQIQVFIATISDIKTAIEDYYGISVSEETFPDIKTKVIEVEGYAGRERRRFLRFKANIEVHFAYQEKYKKTHTKDISGGGICFFSENRIPQDTYLTLEINLPPEVIDRPIASVIKVVRIKDVKNKKMFEIGAVFVQLDPLDRTVIIEYAKKCQLDNYCLPSRRLSRK